PGRRSYHQASQRRKPLADRGLRTAEVAVDQRMIAAEVEAVALLDAAQYSADHRQRGELAEQAVIVAPVHERLVGDSDPGRATAVAEEHAPFFGIDVDVETRVGIVRIRARRRPIDDVERDLDEPWFLGAEPALLQPFERRPRPHRHHHDITKLHKQRKRLPACSSVRLRSCALETRSMKTVVATRYGGPEVLEI